MPANFVERTPLDEIKKLVRGGHCLLQQLAPNTDKTPYDEGGARVTKVLDKLCQSSNPAYVEAALELDAESNLDEDCRCSASEVAFSHTEEFLKLFSVDHISDHKLRSAIKLLIQEGVLRRDSFEGVDAIVTLWSELKKSEDP